MTFTIERVALLLAALALLVFGALILGYGDTVVFALHGWMIAGAAAATALHVLGTALEGPGDPARGYNDRPVRWAVLATCGWAVLGFAIGNLLAWQLVFPDLNGWLAETNFGRLRPVHTTAVVFGFAGNALIGTSFYVVQRTCRARLAGEFAPELVVLFFNLFVLLGVTGYPFGITQSKEYAEPEWYADLVLLVTWVGYLAVYLATLARRAERHIYVANWYYMAFIIVIAMLHVVNNLAVPVSFATPKSYSLFTGVQDAMTQWWYGHNAVGFLLTAGFLGMLYYFLPKATGRPVWSYRLSIMSFWGITFLYLWAGSHHLHYTALPDWVQVLGMTMSVILLVPSWGSVFNGILTLNGAWDQVRRDPAVRFMFAAVLFYGFATFEGSTLAIKPVNTLSHYTDWTVGHVHGGALGWVAFITFGALYKLVPWITGRSGVYARGLVEAHFWLALAGTLIYVGALLVAGLTQSLMWYAYDDGGHLVHGFMETVDAMQPYYVLRAVGGFLYLAGALIGGLNLYLTVRGRTPADGVLQPAE